MFKKGDKVLVVYSLEDPEQIATMTVTKSDSTYTQLQDGDRKLFVYTWLLWPESAKETIVQLIQEKLELLKALKSWQIKFKTTRTKIQEKLK